MRTTRQCPPLYTAAGYPQPSEAKHQYHCGDCGGLYWDVAGSSCPDLACGGEPTPYIMADDPLAEPTFAEDVTLFRGAVLGIGGTIEDLLGPDVVTAIPGNRIRIKDYVDPNTLREQLRQLRESSQSGFSKEPDA